MRARGVAVEQHLAVAPGAVVAAFHPDDGAALAGNHRPSSCEITPSVFVGGAQFEDFVAGVNAGHFAIRLHNAVPAAAVLDAQVAVQLPRVFGGKNAGVAGGIFVGHGPTGAVFRAVAGDEAGFEDDAKVGVGEHRRLVIAGEIERDRHFDVVDVHVAS